MKKKITEKKTIERSDGSSKVERTSTKEDRGYSASEDLSPRRKVKETRITEERRSRS